jgi:arylsulfatase A-like enzyme
VPRFKRPQRWVAALSLIIPGAGGHVPVSGMENTSSSKALRDVVSLGEDLQDGSRRGGRPNVLIMITDDQRHDMLNVMERTSRWFGRGGTTFTHAFANTPLCCPSRATIFTGRYTHNHGVLNNYSAGLLNHRSTLQRYLRSTGYRTGIAGKFLNNWPLSRDPPFFDQWAIFNVNWSYYDVPFNVNGHIQKRKGYSTDAVQRHALRFIRRFESNDRRPWLLYVTPFAPHTPVTPAPRHARRSVPPFPPNPAVDEQDRSDKPPIFRQRELSDPGRRNVARKQLRTLLSVDGLVGRIRQQLRQLGEENRTLAFFLSDNGFLLAEHGLIGKQAPYTESVQIPFLVRWPGRLAPGTVDSRLVSTTDVAPTALAAAGVRPPARPPLDGRDLLSTSRDRVLLEYFVDPSRPIPRWSSIRTTTYQYVEYYGTEGGTSFREYYDLVGDPWQLTNVLADGDLANDPPPEHLEQMERTLAADRSCRGTGGPRACP